jgi:hypothetical protein
MTHNQISQVGEAFRTEQETCNHILGGVANLKTIMPGEINGNPEATTTTTGKMRLRSAQNHRDSQQSSR